MIPKLDRVAFSIFGIDIMWYAILISFGMVLGILLATKEAKRRGISEDDLSDILLVSLPLSIVGARLYYVIFQWDYYKNNPIEIINIRGGGLAIYGGIIAAYLAAYFMSKKKKINFLDITDLTAPSLALGQAIGRWGNFINMEAHGTETNLPWAVIIDGKSYHPTFLYESLGNFIIFIFLLYYSRNKQKAKGEVISFYLIFYGILRFFVEGLRTDSLYFLGFRISQIVSIIFILVGIYLIINSRKKIIK